MKFLLGTDHVSVLQQQSGPDYGVLSARIGQQPTADLALSIIRFHEQVLGCNAYIARARTPADLVRGYAILLRLFSDYAIAGVLTLDAAATAVIDGFRAQRLRVGAMDLRIASIAVSRGLTLLTRNFRDFRQVPGLITEDWTT